MNCSCTLNRMKTNKGMRSTKKGRYDKSVKARNETYRGIRKYSRVKK